MTTLEKINQKEKELEELKAQLEKEQNDPKKFITELLNGLTVKIDTEKYPNSTFFFRGDEVILELEKSDEINYLWCRYYKFWNPISEKFSLDDSQTQQLIKEAVEDHFKMSDVTPTNKKF
ncbi:hypothetical protein [Chryseobacterium taichungense]|uniref:hypothetical protein n=1 Tax=Chryseobacterium taichungense TaxID=295069 RepID=UPI0028AF2654|nr:hypothetical protein [Chryseobacterium taichungense]